MKLGRSGKTVRILIVLVEIKVRLTASHSGSSSEGRVEIEIAGVWGTLQSAAWDIRDGHVICRQLGYTKGAAAVFVKNKYGGASGPTWSFNFRCRGNESSLSDCDHWDFPSVNTDHSDDVNVVCRVTDENILGECIWKSCNYFQNLKPFLYQNN